MPTDDDRMSPPQGAPPQSANGGRPSWLPDGFNSPEDFRKAYDTDRSRLGELEQRSETLKAWEKWGDPGEFEKNLAARIAARDKQLQEQWERQHQSAQRSSEPQDPYANYELLSPREQAALQQKLITDAVLKATNDMIGQRWQEAQSQINQTDQRFSLLSRALSEKARNPDLDLNQLWKEANTLATGDQNQLFDLAAERVLSPSKVKKQIEDAIAAKRVEWEAEQKAKEQAALVGSNHGSISTSFKDTLAARKEAKTDTQRNNSIKSRVLEKAINEGWIHPAQV